MIKNIIEWFKKQGEKYELWLKEQERRRKKWEQEQRKKIPQSLKKLVELYPLLKLMYGHNSFLIDPELESGNQENEAINHIKEIQENIVDKIYQNAIESRNGVGGRTIRPATEMERERYEKMTTHQAEIWRIRNNNNIISSFSGIPEAKVYHLRKMGAKVGARVLISSSNIIDPYFPDLISIGDNTILGLGASIICHEFIDGQLYLGEVEIGSNCLVAFDSIILPGTKMEKNSILTPGILMSDLKEDTMAKGLTGSIRIKKEDSKKGESRSVETLNFTLHDYFTNLIFPKEKPFKTAFCNLYLEWQKSPLISQSFRQRLLKLAGIKIGKNVEIEENVRFDTFYPEKISIGNRVLIKKGATIITHEATVHSFRTGNVDIEDDVKIESGVKILPGVKIGKNSIIRPYLVVHNSIPPDTELKENI